METDAITGEENSNKERNVKSRKSEVDSLAQELWLGTATHNLQLPVSAPWSSVSRALNMVWRARVSYTEPLSPSHLATLATKLPGYQQGEFLVTWDHFHGKALPRAPFPPRTQGLSPPLYDFSFFAWFHATMITTLDHLEGPWRKRLVEGFIDRQKAEKMVVQRPPGTFLLRFSDSQLGGVSIVCNKEGQGVSYAPFSDLHVRNIADSIFDSELTFLYPATPVQEFQEFRSQQGAKSGSDKDGYVPRTLCRNYPKNIKDSK